jgi:hypothetical protein
LRTVNAAVSLAATLTRSIRATFAPRRAGKNRRREMPRRARTDEGGDSRVPPILLAQLALIGKRGDSLI